MATLSAIDVTENDDLVSSLKLAREGIRDASKTAINNLVVSSLDNVRVHHRFYMDSFEAEVMMMEDGLLCARCGKSLESREEAFIDDLLCRSCASITSTSPKTHNFTSYKLVSNKPKVYSFAGVIDNDSLVEEHGLLYNVNPHTSEHIETTIVSVEPRVTVTINNNTIIGG